MIRLQIEQEITLSSMLDHFKPIAVMKDFRSYAVIGSQRISNRKVLVSLGAF